MFSRRRTAHSSSSRRRSSCAPARCAFSRCSCLHAGRRRSGPSVNSSGTRGDTVPVRQLRQQTTHRRSTAFSVSCEDTSLQSCSRRQWSSWISAARPRGGPCSGVPGPGSEAPGTRSSSLRAIPAAAASQHGLAVPTARGGRGPFHTSGRWRSGEAHALARGEEPAALAHECTLGALARRRQQPTGRRRRGGGGGRGGGAGGGRGGAAALAGPTRAAGPGGQSPPTPAARACRPSWGSQRAVLVGRGDLSVALVALGGPVGPRGRAARGKMDPPSSELARRQRHPALESVARAKNKASSVSPGQRSAAGLACGHDAARSAQRLQCQSNPRARAPDILHACSSSMPHLLVPCA